MREENLISEKDTFFTSPKLIDMPVGTEKRLIDTGMLHYEASIAGFNERYRRGETSHTIHVWWARRPHSAMRSVVFASLCKDTSPNAFNKLKNIGGSGLIKDDELAITFDVFDNQYDHIPKVLDMFGGGGTIPFEVANIGADSYSIDANQLSVFIQKCNLIYSQNIQCEDIQSIVKESGENVLRRLTDETEDLFPKRRNSEDGTIGYLWTYSIECPECKYQYYINKRPWLSKKKKNLAFVVKDNSKKQKLEIEEVDKQYKLKSNWIGRTSSVKCPKCSHENKNISIKMAKDEVVATIIKNKGTGKSFSTDVSGALPSDEFLKDREQKLLERLNVSLPSSELPKWSGIVNPAIYGIETHADAQNLRQRIVILTLIEELKNEYLKLIEKYESNIAKFIISLLSGLIDQLVDWNCRISMWISQNEQVGRAFSGPGIPMYWDYVEIDPVMRGPANLYDKLDRIIAGANSITKFREIPKVKHAYAQELPFENEFFDAIVTDPPYYDNIYYTVLADFFFAWKRILLSFIEPELFSNTETDKTHELVASTYRSESFIQAHEDYCVQLTKAIKEAARVVKPEGVFSFIYAHSSINGWEAMVRAFRESSFVITSVEPLSIERKQRPRAMTSQAVNTCITFVAHKSNDAKEPSTIKKLKDKLDEVCGTFAEILKNSGWSEEDIGIALFANAVGLVANCSQVEGFEDNIEVLKLLAEVVRKKVPSFQIKVRKSL